MSGIAAETEHGIATESERLARRFFSLYQQGERAKVLELVHPEIEWVLMTIRPGEMLRGREEARHFSTRSPTSSSSSLRRSSRRWTTSVSSSRGAGGRSTTTASFETTR